jgi:sugar/nucleoside kinase (ribokinase family)
VSRNLLVCAGSLTLDNVMTADDRLLPRAPGGNVIYSGLGARLWHPRVGLVSRAGADFPEASLERLATRGLDVAGVRRVPEPHGMNVAFRYASDGSRVRRFPPDAVALIPKAERARFVDYGAGSVEDRFRIWSAFAPDGADLPDAWLPALAGLHCAAMPVGHHRSIAARVRSETPGAWLQVDSPWYDERNLSRDEASPLLALIDALLPSLDDVVRVAPGTPVEESVAAIMARGARLLVLKLGGEGCRVVRPGAAPVVVPACQGTPVIEPTGAGDAFCGGFLAGLHLTGDPLEAALRGTVSASFAIEAPGFEGLMRDRRAEADARLAALRARL